MISKPILTIDKFSGMSDEGGIYHIDGFSIEKESGLTSLDENYLSSELINTSTTGYSNLGNVAAIAYVYPLKNSNIGGGNAYTLTLSDGTIINAYDTVSEIYHGKVGGAAGSSPYLYCQKPDIFELNSGNIAWTSAYHLGIGYRGLAKSGSSSTKIIDTSGRNFTALGFSTSAPNNKVTNLLTGSEYTITSITTTNSTNDTLNFTAIGATTNAENDEFIAWLYTAEDLGSSAQFVGQSDQVYWSRPIKQYGSQYMILNGNYIALLANDETTFDATYKQLPIGYQGITFEVGGADMILVSAYDKKGQSHLLLWDGSSSGWQEDLKIDRAPSSIKAYNYGFVYIADGTIYYTDGRTIQKLISHPDTKDLGAGINTISHNGIAIVNDVIYIAGFINNTNRQKSGIYVFNNKTGLSYFKCKSLGKGFATPYCIYVNPNSNIGSIFSTSNDIEIGCESSLNNLNIFQRSTSTSDWKSFMLLIDFKQETQIKEVWLNLKPVSKSYSEKGKYCNIYVNYGNGENGIINRVQATTTPTTTSMTINGVTFPNNVIGTELEIVDNTNSGQRSFITAITDPNTTNEVWTISPALAATNSGTNELRIWNVKNGEQKTININQLNIPHRFNINFIGSKMYLEIAVRGITNGFPVSIQDILLF